MHVKNLRIKLNGQYYPDELMNLDIGGEKYRIIYQMYQDYKKLYHDSDNMYYNPKEFIENRTLYVIDTTKTPVNISNSKNDIIITVDFEYDIQLTSKTKLLCCCCIRKIIGI